MSDTTISKPMRPFCHCKCDVCSRKDYIQCIVTLYFDEIKYDVQYALWQKARFTAEITEAEKEKYELTDDDTDWLVRQIDTYVNNAKASVVFSKPMSEKKLLATDVLNTTPEEWSLTMRLSPTWRGSADLVASALHNYVVSGVMKEWSLMAQPDMAANYEAVNDGLELKLISLTRCSTLERPVFGF
jgi:hypothetical protein